jgi:SET domain-containing protein
MPSLVASPTVPLRFAVRSSPIHGRGLFAVDPIPRRMKLGELSGVLRRLPDFRNQVKGREVIHLVEISRRWALDCSQGNHFRHLNHRCIANCYMRLANRRVEIYSRRAIPAGEELTVDYRETIHPDGMPCHCGAPGCRSRL